MTSKKKMRYGILYIDRWTSTTNCQFLLEPELPLSAEVITRSSSLSLNTLAKSEKSLEVTLESTTTRLNSEKELIKWRKSKEIGG